MVKAYLGLGSNMGDRAHQLQQAIQIIDRFQHIDVTSVSPIYETEPVGYTDQPQFLNLCIEIETTLKPQELLKRCLETEQALHRVRKIRWGPRTLDVDILLYGNEIIEEDNLIIPHPRMVERAFVLIPLNDIASKHIEPRSQRLIENLVTADSTVKRYMS
ncbi:2-amino-4-hydroxy-6-hydroxymethyldihydropteridine diphosphokinase [Staphylococcus warneri]|jgi:2-amino-4-hydroxy-6-hydroxymethyldihydropteridine diphosphokinase|uniref:2-amino-4-hydroxy-6-hydroxymethyldihydropteridine diphosphokinase n=1 Tax=Staphylococcus warneri TaxID=1292 RepID=A0A2T4PZN6_STAWA|nr:MULTISPECIES: 2-amino-4-hydroxy-6-hydroxymethyldihydropteridine diphosphokinase [Staphylococcus]MBE9430208.1 2-amino-4-hydroxy-6-hydroxymethyldihydropteridine diphosphokinase [Staphylococcus epidermidis]AXV43195.1 putative 2-amino-4-hydroxy-6-hydroxymethyldihydropteridine pyrophosphokinase [Staphylococcus sp. M0911]MBO0378635.1 2-amino-4-hydroxy-6-hydroxymethyldihydropteridine diphosphokinase [Staphylococcus warneri]MCD8805260.1 2-amino-4-hydroxy-6-hydroxymethyldihydropteridine diphosphokina